MSASAPRPVQADGALEDARRQDAVLRELGLEMWIGSEPTFTRKESQDPCWLFQAEGGDKEERARALIASLAALSDPDARLCRTAGRQYPDEPAPRFAFGAVWRRGGGDPGWSGGPLDGAPVERPPSDPGLAWLTVTPDPAVVEVNMAPAPDLETFLHWSRLTYQAAGSAGLSPLRYRFNGKVADSGGGGQLTLGGPSPQSSPFLRHPQLLVRLLRYLNRHPSLSYAFATECIGSASQGPRPDEGVRERFDELGVALDRLAVRDPGAEELWSSLAPLLVDCSGNSHRAELNIEKLWNPHLPGRGRLGLVEFRALRMEPTPERAAAVAALFRAVATRLVVAPYQEPLADWGSDLHDRFALPCFLERDLRAVLTDLAQHGLGLGPFFSAALTEPRPDVARLELEGATLSVTQALEFWPLMGDVASQETRGSRSVDSSTERIQILIRTPRGQSPGKLSACGWKVPLASVKGSPLHVAGVRYRAFVPQPGLHPSMPPQDPLTLDWERNGRAVSLALHGWIPGGGVYHGLPPDGAEAERRRLERVVVAPASLPVPMRKFPGAASVLTMDLRKRSP